MPGSTGRRITTALESRFTFPEWLSLNMLATVPRLRGRECGTPA